MTGLVRYGLGIALVTCFAVGAGALGAHRDGRIHVDVVVTDSTGKPVAGLQQQDFKLLDDGKEKPITSFSAFDGIVAKADPPAQMIVAIDAVNNGFVEMGYARQGLERFLRENQGHLAQPTTIVRLSISGVEFLSEPTRDGNVLAEIVSRTRASVRPKGLDAMLVSFSGLSAIAKKELTEPGRKLLIWLGPGWPTPVPPPGAMTEVDLRNQRVYAGAAIEIARLLHDARIVLYGGYSAGDFYMRDALKPVKRISDVDGRILRLNVLAIKSGGKGELPETNRDSVVAEMLEHFAAEVNSFYEISFDAPATSKVDEFHQLRVDVKRPDLVARTIAGYYGQSALPAPEMAKQAPLVLKPVPVEKQVPPTMVSVLQLIEVVERAKSKRDADATSDFEHLELNERLSSAKLNFLSQELPGPESRSALRAIADASVFLNLPASEVLNRPAPELDEQKRIMSTVLTYLGNTVPKLPNFYARRTTISFEALATEARAGEGSSYGGVLRRSGEGTVTILYRDGKEAVKDETPRSSANSEQFGLITKGIFGSVLSTVIVDASHGEARWNHWEDGPEGPIAVFAYRVSLQQSHYEVSYPGSGMDAEFASAYHGQIGIDIATGAIMRLVLEADLEPGLPLERADIMVEYGKVEIGKQSYTCPLRSVSISRGESVSGGGKKPEPVREVTRLNDEVFDGYHIFRSEMRIVPD